MVLGANVINGKNAAGPSKYPDFNCQLVGKVGIPVLPHEATPVNVAPVKIVPLRLLPAIVALARLAPARLVFVKLVFATVASVSVALWKSRLRRLAPVRFTVGPTK